jgi:hypothetical protein
VEPSQGWHSSRFVQDHLQEAHKDKLATLTDAQLEKNELFVCRECDEKIFVSLTALNNHVRRNHCQSRSLTNLELVEQHIFKDLQGSYDSFWQDGLAFLKSLPLEPPPFRQCLTSKIRFRLEQTVCNTFLSTIEVANESLKPLPHHNLINKADYDPWPFIQLPILFEQLVLIPIPKSSNHKHQHSSLNSTIHDRIRRFKQGKLCKLYEESRQIQSKTPREQANNPVEVQKAAQLAADLDNFKSANARVTKHAPVALINDTNIHVLRNLHPPSLCRGCVKPTKSTRSGGTKRKVTFTPKHILKTLSHLHRGKATGIHCDSLDIYIKSARRISLNDTDGLHKATALSQFFCKIINGDIPEPFKHFIRQTYLVALEKDPEDKTKLRPLGVPSAIR